MSLGHFPRRAKGPSSLRVPSDGSKESSVPSLGVGGKTEGLDTRRVRCPRSLPRPLHGGGPVWDLFPLERPKDVPQTRGESGPDKETGNGRHVQEGRVETPAFGCGRSGCGKKGEDVTRPGTEGTPEPQERRRTSEYPGPTSTGTTRVSTDLRPSDEVPSRLHTPGEDAGGGTRRTTPPARTWDS